MICLLMLAVLVNICQAWADIPVNIEVVSTPHHQFVSAAAFYNVPPAIIISANNVCPGVTIIFTAAPANASYLWYKNGQPTGVTTVTYSSNSFQNNDQISCYVTDNLGGAMSNVITVNLGSVQPPAVNISASSAFICQGTAVTFTAVPVNGGAAPVYQWQVNGISAGTNSSTFTTTALNNNDDVTCIMLSNANCIVPVPVTSYSIFMNVSAIVQPKAKILITAANACAGTPMELSMNFTVGTPVSYQWKINGVNATTASSLKTANFADNDKVRCDVLVNTQCTLAVPFTDSVTMHITPVVSPSVNISASADSICEGLPITFSAVTSNAGSNIFYQWKVNNVNSGNNSNLFTTLATKNNDVVTCQITPKASQCLLQNTVTSNSLIARVFSLPTITLPPVQNITIGSSLLLDPVINGSIIKYLWSPASDLNNPNIKNPVATPTKNATYTLTVISAGGCTTTASTSINVSAKKVNGVPIAIINTFTPNGDAINDNWEIQNIENYPHCLVDVFNRYGLNIFHSLGYTEAWNGCFNNKPLPAGIYYYIIDLKDGSQAIGGTIALVR